MNNNNIETKELLELGDIKLEKIEKKEDISGRKYNICWGFSNNKPKKCPCCRKANKIKYKNGKVKSESIVKNGVDIGTVLLGKIFNTTTILKLKKQKYKCKKCGKCFRSETNIVKKGCNISNKVIESVVEGLEMIISRKDISKQCLVSESTVLRIQSEVAKKLRKRPTDRLPKHLCFDELKTTKDVDSAMSFIYSDAETHELIDVVDDRKERTLKEYFIRYSYKVRKQVETICIDMYMPYMNVIKEMFPNAEIIIDKFHIVQALNRELNRYRVKVMNTHRTKDRPLYNKFKKYWKLILTNRENLEYYRYKKHRLFKEMKTTKEIVDYVLSTNDVLFNTYIVVHGLREAIKEKDYKTFFEILNNCKNIDICEGLSRVVRTFRKYERYIKNTLTYNFTNGSLEGINNKIKTIKRIGFGYKNFYHLRDRILISFNRNIKLINEVNTAIPFADLRKSA